MEAVEKALEGLGIEIEQPEIIAESNEGKKYGSPITRTMTITNADRISAVQAGLVPEAYADCEFDLDKVQDNFVQQRKTSGQNFSIMNFSAYSSTLLDILDKIRNGKMIDGSYLIGAPNGAGKTSFANTCIQIIHARNGKAVPYISLSELAEIKNENEKKLMSGLSGKFGFKDGTAVPLNSYEPSYVRTPTVVIGQFSWSEYINADVLFTYLTSVLSKALESHMLKLILDIRGAKGLPTVVFMETAINPYLGDTTLKRYVWDDIYLTKGLNKCYDRVAHISCYKKYNVAAEMSEG